MQRWCWVSLIAIGICSPLWAQDAPPANPPPAFKAVRIPAVIGQGVPVRADYTGFSIREIRMLRKPAEGEWQPVGVRCRVVSTRPVGGGSVWPRFRVLLLSGTETLGEVTFPGMLETSPEIGPKQFYYWERTFSLFRKKLPDGIAFAPIEGPVVVEAPAAAPAAGGTTPAPGGTTPAPGGTTPAPGGTTPAAGGTPTTPAPAAPGATDTTAAQAKQIRDVLDLIVARGWPVTVTIKGDQPVPDALAALAKEFGKDGKSGMENVLALAKAIKDANYTATYIQVQTAQLRQVPVNDIRFPEGNAPAMSRGKDLDGKGRDVTWARYGWLIVGAVAGVDTQQISYALVDVKALPAQ